MATYNTNPKFNVKFDSSKSSRTSAPSYARTSSSTSSSTSYTTAKSSGIGDPRAGQTLKPRIVEISTGRVIQKGDVKETPEMRRKELARITPEPLVYVQPKKFLGIFETEKNKLIAQRQEEVIKQGVMASRTITKTAQEEVEKKTEKKQKELQDQLQRQAGQLQKQSQARTKDRLLKAGLEQKNGSFEADSIEEQTQGRRIIEQEQQRLQKETNQLNTRIGVQFEKQQNDIIRQQTRLAQTAARQSEQIILNTTKLQPTRLQKTTRGLVSEELSEKSLGLSGGGSTELSLPTPSGFARVLDSASPVLTPTRNFLRKTEKEMVGTGGVSFSPGAGRFVARTTADIIDPEFYRGFEKEIRSQIRNEPAKFVVLGTITAVGTAINPVLGSKVAKVSSVLGKTALTGYGAVRTQQFISAKTPGKRGGVLAETGLEAGAIVSGVAVGRSVIKAGTLAINKPKIVTSRSETIRFKPDAPRAGKDNRIFESVTRQKSTVKIGKQDVKIDVVAGSQQKANSKVISSIGRGQARVGKKVTLAADTATQQLVLSKGNKLAFKQIQGFERTISPSGRIKTTFGDSGTQAVIKTEGGLKKITSYTISGNKAVAKRVTFSKQFETPFSERITGGSFDRFIGKSETVSFKSFTKMVKTSNKLPKGVKLVIQKPKPVVQKGRVLFVGKKAQVSLNNLGQGYGTSSLRPSTQSLRLVQPRTESLIRSTPVARARSVGVASQVQAGRTTNVLVKGVSRERASALFGLIGTPASFSGAGVGVGALSISRGLVLPDVKVNVGLQSVTRGLASTQPITQPDVFSVSKPSVIPDVESSVRTGSSVRLGSISTPVNIPPVPPPVLPPVLFPPTGFYFPDASGVNGFKQGGRRRKRVQKKRVSQTLFGTFLDKGLKRSSTPRKIFTGFELFR